jgi:hypothetical protein
VINSWRHDDRLALLETWSQAGQSKGTNSVPAVVNYGQWQHAAVTLDRTSGSVALYVDGAPVKLTLSNFAPDFTDSQPLSIGRYYDGLMMSTTSMRPIQVPAPFHFTGLIDDLRVYDTVLTAAEIRDLGRPSGAARVPFRTIPETAHLKAGRTGAAKGAEARAPSSAWAFLISHSVTGIVWTAPASTIRDHGVPLTANQLKAVEAQDGVCLDEGAYHLFRIPNRGITQVEWTGYGNGNAQILIHYWDGSQMQRKDIRGASELATHRIPVSVPASEEFVYVMVNCTNGQVFTDAITHDGSATPSP